MARQSKNDKIKHLENMLATSEEIREQLAKRNNELMNI